MKVDGALIDRLAELSKLEFNEKEKIEIQKDLSNILSFMEKLNEVNTDDVEPLVYINEDVNVVREDVVKDVLKQEEVLKNAPIKDDTYIKVPKVIEQP
ncbi:MAG: Asp-tRNA(Asn)/Glu-tRNA(Gln) amidotransferase subunit GatC [Bacteroidetes bacterium]|nr:Asp-tRNA(Asn)/Glu-tRNA(Gln) amidotransferase subunit GatC [Bacteroidota bacterium]